MSHWRSGRVSTIIWITSRYCSKILNGFGKKKNLEKHPLWKIDRDNEILVNIWVYFEELENEVFFVFDSGGPLNQEHFNR